MTCCAQAPEHRAKLTAALSIDKPGVTVTGLLFFILGFLWSDRWAITFRYKGFFESYIIDYKYYFVMLSVIFSVRLTGCQFFHCFVKVTFKQSILHDPVLLKFAFRMRLGKFRRNLAAVL